MEFRDVYTPKAIKAYIKFIKAHYQGDSLYRDYTTPVLEEILKGKGKFAKAIQQHPYLIYEVDKCIGVVNYIQHEAYKEVLQITFMEYIEGYQVLEHLLEKGHELAKACGATKLVVGLNGHVNYGLGLSEKNDMIPTFGSNYTKQYYSRDLKCCGGRDLKLSTYQYQWDPPRFPVEEVKLKRILKDIQFRPMTPKTHTQDMAVYTKLNNECFNEHPYYFKRSVEEDKELFKGLKYFLVEGSLIFAEYKGEPIGFLLWYPDWGELMNQGETVGVKTFLKAKLYRHKVKTFKIMEWGVIPRFQGRGIPIGLLYACYEKVKNQGFKYCKTSWIVDDNKNSSHFGTEWATVKETYCVYEFDVRE